MNTLADRLRALADRYEADAARLRQAADTLAPVPLALDAPGLDIVMGMIRVVIEEDMDPAAVLGILHAHRNQTS